MSQKTKRSHSDIPIYQRLRFKLIIFFLIPALCIVALGVVSYQKASNAIIASYESSASQTMNMTNQYLTLAINTVRSTYKSYLNETEIIYYFQGIYDTDTALRTNTNKSYTKEFNTCVNTDDLVSNIYLISDSEPSITTTSTQTEMLYSLFTDTPEGALAKGDKYNYYLLGNQSTVNEALGTDSSSYALRLVRGFNKGPGMMIIDISKSAVVDTLSSIDTGEGGYTAFITSDGTELYPDGTSSVSDTVFTETEFYQAALASEEESGEKYVEWQGQTYLFLYSLLPINNAMICTLIPRSTIIAQVSGIQTLTILIVIIAILIASLLGSFMSRHINKNIYLIFHQLQKISDGDLTDQLNVKTKD